MTETIKVKYDYGQRVFEYEGPKELMDSVLESFLKHDVSKSFAVKAGKVSAKQAPSKKAKTNSSKVSGYKPKYNPELDLVGLSAFYDGLVLKSVPERVLAFIIYLTENLGMDVITPDDIYSCFYSLQKIIKLPSYPKALENAKLKSHYIEYDGGYANPRTTMTGVNFFNHEIKKREAKS